jgi:hypothetical protein
VGGQPRLAITPLFFGRDLGGFLVALPVALHRSHRYPVTPGDDGPTLAFFTGFDDLFA